MSELELEEYASHLNNDISSTLSDLRNDDMQIYDGYITSDGDYTCFSNDEDYKKFKEILSSKPFSLDIDNYEYIAIIYDGFIKKVYVAESMDSNVIGTYPYDIKTTGTLKDEKNLIMQKMTTQSTTKATTTQTTTTTTTTQSTTTTTTTTTQALSPEEMAFVGKWEVVKWAYDGEEYDNAKYIQATRGYPIYHNRIIINEDNTMDITDFDNSGYHWCTWELVSNKTIHVIQKDFHDSTHVIRNKNVFDRYFSIDGDYLVDVVDDNQIAYYVKVDELTMIKEAKQVATDILFNMNITATALHTETFGDIFKLMFKDYSIDVSIPSIAEFSNFEFDKYQLTISGDYYKDPKDMSKTQYGSITFMVNNTDYATYSIEDDPDNILSTIYKFLDETPDSTTSKNTEKETTTEETTVGIKPFDFTRDEFIENYQKVLMNTFKRNLTFVGTEESSPGMLYYKYDFDDYIHIKINCKNDTVHSISVNSDYTFKEADAMAGNDMVVLIGYLLFSPAAILNNESDLAQGSVKELMGKLISNADSGSAALTATDEIAQYILITGTNDVSLLVLPVDFAE